MTILSLILVSALNWVFKWFTKWPRNQLVLVCKEPWILKMYCTNCVQSSLMSHTLWVTPAFKYLMIIHLFIDCSSVCLYLLPSIHYVSIFLFFKIILFFLLCLLSLSNLSFSTIRTSVWILSFYPLICLSISNNYPIFLKTICLSVSICLPISTIYPSVWRLSFDPSPSVNPSQLTIHLSEDYHSIRLHLLIHLNYLSICLKTIILSVSIC